MCYNNVIQGLAFCSVLQRGFSKELLGIFLGFPWLTRLIEEHLWLLAIFESWGGGSLCPSAPCPVADGTLGHSHLHAVWEFPEKTNKPFFVTLGGALFIFF